MMKEKCFYCKNGFHFFNGMCRCFIEPSDCNQHYDNYCCQHYEPVNEKTLEERMLWKTNENFDNDITKKMINLEQIAEEAASTYCRCSQCNGINPDMGINCDKKRGYTCNRYFIGYETALIALEKMNNVLGNPVDKVEQEDYLGLKSYRHWVDCEHIENYQKT